LIRCPACRADVELRAAGQSAMVACSACGTEIDISQPQSRIIRRFHDAPRRPLLPLGSRGTLRDKDLQVIGALQRSDSKGYWHEYLLFNSSTGFCWLVYDTGHWSLGVAVEDTSQLVVNALVRYDGRGYRRFRSGTAEVDWVVGEFYWGVHRGEQVFYVDYIAPPLMLTSERARGETVWTKLEYIEPAEIDAAFGITSPPRQWVSSNQPNPARLQLRRILPALVASCVAVAAIQICTVLRVREVAFPSATYHFGAVNEAPEKVFGPFAFTAPHSLNEVTASAGLNNSWVELDCVLVNATTGETFEFTDAFSYYSGTDSDGSWSEGGFQNTALLADIPSGTYNLVVEGLGADQSGRPLSQPVTLSLRHDVVPWTNFWLVLLAILAYPGYLLYRGRADEKERWESATP
jgi:hypothetical protein